MKGLWVLAMAGLLVAAGGASMAAAPWNQSLSYDGGGYWPVRVPLEIQNTSGAALDGTAVHVTISTADGTSALIDLRVASVRVVEAGGAELLFDIVDADGAPKHEGKLAAGDVLTLPAEAKAGENPTVYIYAGNEKAWAVPDWLTSGLVNLGFEAGTDATPAGWGGGTEDAQHRMSRVKGGAHSGDWCAKCEVDEGASATWVQYNQTSIPVTVGTKYRFTGWVKAEGVKGAAGWYIHVNGTQPQMVNKSEQWDGTFDWRIATIEFEVPVGGQTMQCGTLLHGTGVAWFDDAKLEVVGGGKEIEARVGDADKRELKVIGDAAPWPAGGEWAWRAPMRVRNFDDAAAPARMVTFDTRHLRNRMAKLLGFSATPGLMVVDPEQPDSPAEFGGSLDDQISAATSVPARSEKVLWLYASATPPKPHAALPASQMGNLAINGSMEEGQGITPAGWTSGLEGNRDSTLWTAKRVRGGIDGDWCLELTAPVEMKEVGWVGWREKVATTPGMAYVLSGYLKTKGIDGDVHIHGHWLKADGSLATNAFFSTGQGLSGNSDWTKLSVMAVAPPDAAQLEIHLTMNCHGTVWHDKVRLTEASMGVAGEIEARKAPAELTAWPVNSQVKTFGEDLPPLKMSQSIAIAAARNQYEAFQVAVYCPRDAQLTVGATALTGPGGAKIAAPDVYDNRRVPVDFNIGYDSTKEPTYHRMLARNRGGDGWPGQWPDPLAPVKAGTVAVKAGVCEALWFDVHVPAEAKPGTYKGTVEISAGGKTIQMPVTLAVWNFTLPVERKCVAMMDLGLGGAMQVIPGKTMDESRRIWWRLLAKYNVSPSYSEPYPEFKYENGKVTMDATKFDQEAHFLLDELHCNRVYTPWLFYAAGWAYTPGKFLGVDPTSPDYEKVWKEAYKLYIDHLTEKGWRKKVEYYLSDEPHAENQPTIDGLNRLADLAKSVAPDVPIYSSTWVYIKGLAGHLTMWGAGPQGGFAPSMMAERRDAGDRFIFTTDGQMCTDTPLLAIERILPWLDLKYDIEGYEFWGSNWWTYDPWQIGWHKFISQSDNGKEYYFVRYPNGDGFLTYPGSGCGQAEPVASIRLQAAREGVDDYEILAALQKHAKAGNAEARRALDRVLELVQIPNAGGRMSTSLMGDPEKFTAARMAAGEVLSRIESK